MNDIFIYKNKIPLSFKAWSQRLGGGRNLGFSSSSSPLFSSKSLICGDMKIET